MQVPEEVFIRPAAEGDAESICTIYNSAIDERESTFETEPRSAADFGERIAQERGDGGWEQR